MLETDKIFQNGMMLQREKPVKIWGRADAGNKVEVLIQGKRAAAIASKDSRWEMEIPPLSASEKEQMFVYSGDQTVQIDDVAIGEVWIAGGQSNMEFQICYEKHWDRVKQEAANENLRFYDVPEISYNGQDKDFDYSHVGVWRKADSEDLRYFSAVGYYFQKEIAEKENVPVGIIGINWGGTRSSAWVCKDTIEKTGTPWIQLYEKEFSNVNKEEYWKAQKNNPLNDHGNPNMDSFSAFMLPRTPSQEEIMEFLDRDEEKAKQPFLEMPSPQNIPSCLFEHMVKPTAPYTVRGVIWYQGESDDGCGMQDIHGKMLQGVINDWRKEWGEKHLPFLVVQLPGWRSWFGGTNNNFAAIRRYQEEVCRKEKNAWLCSASDAGEEFDIHPKDKMAIGHRLALLACGHIYGESILCDAPILKRADKDPYKICLTFSNAESGLKIKGDEIQALTVKTGKREVSYHVNIKADQVELIFEEPLTDKVTIDFAQDCFYCVNLYNEADIPAIPFSVEC